MKKIAVLILSVLLYQAYGQNCETFGRSLFHMLPKEIPDTVNCIDNYGQKQGWWLFYRVQYNPFDQPDLLDKGNYVERYSYGRYENDRRVGKWKFIENVHLIHVTRIDSFYYGVDSIIFISEFASGGWHETMTHYNGDSTIIQHSHLQPGANHRIIIACDKQLPLENQCRMTYRGIELEEFPFERFEIEKSRLTFEYQRERKFIDEQTDNKNGSK